MLYAQDTTTFEPSQRLTSNEVRVAPEYQHLKGYQKEEVRDTKRETSGTGQENKDVQDQETESETTETWQNLQARSPVMNSRRTNVDGKFAATSAMIQT